MNLLKRENWWVWLLLFLFSGGSSTITLAALLNVLDKNAWYAKWYIWVIGFVLVIPFVFMVYILLIEMVSKCSAKLDIKGSEYYLSPYVWIILIIIPIVGWIAFIALFLYLNIKILIELNKGKGEKYIS